MVFHLQPCNEAELKICSRYEQDTEVIQNLFFGKENECLLLPASDKENPHTLMIGLGKQKEVTEEKIRNSFGKAIKQAVCMKIKKIQIESVPLLNITEEEFLRGMITGINLSNYSFDKYKTKEDKKEENAYHKNEIEIYIQNISDTKENQFVIEEAKNLTDSINSARDMIAEPTNKLFPEEFAHRACIIGKESGFQIEVLEEEELKQLKMEAFLTVGMGSPKKPRLIVMKYLNGGDQPLKGLVGKGLTCDTGGYSLKSSESLMYMKSDMSGAASVLAVMSAVAKNKCRVNVCAVVACCENVLSGNSYKPGDIVTAMSGKTIEVLNTDAEGRLTLADALTYIIEKEKVTKVIDIATLTGVAGTTFGNVFTPFITNNETLKEEFLEAAEKTEEMFWPMPNHKRYQKMIESEIADIKNTAGAGTITAGMFLQEFIGETPWIHLDIAATAVLNPSPFEYVPNGPSGVAIRTIYQWIKES